MIHFWTFGSKRKESHEQSNREFVLAESCTCEIAGLSEVSWNRGETGNLSLECSMTHLLRAGILFSPGNSVVRAGRVQLFKAIIKTTTASLPSSTLHPLKCDWWESPAWPSMVLWHTARGKDSEERRMRGRGQRIWTLSLPPQISASTVYALHNTQVQSCHPWQRDAVAAEAVIAQGHGDRSGLPLPRRYLKKYCIVIM